MAEILATKHDASLARLVEPSSSIGGDTSCSDAAGTGNPSPMASLKKITDLFHRAAFEKVAKPRDSEMETVRRIRVESRQKLDEYITKCPEAAPLLGTFGKSMCLLRPRRHSHPHPHPRPHPCFRPSRCERYAGREMGGAGRSRPVVRPCDKKIQGQDDGWQAGEAGCSTTSPPDRPDRPDQVAYSS